MGAVTFYDYDKNNRLTSETKVMGAVSEITRYKYDDNGNQIYKGLEIIKPVMAGEGESISASVLGEGTDDAGVTINQYDGFNRLIKVMTGNIIAAYAYNGDGLRISKTVNDATTKHVWDGNQIVLEMDGNGAVTGKYIRGINLITAENAAGIKQYYMYDGHGDVVQLTGDGANELIIYNLVVSCYGTVLGGAGYNAAADLNSDGYINLTDYNAAVVNYSNAKGKVIKTYDYDAFGNEKNPDPADTNVFRYAGEYFDRETGTIYLRARYYDPMIGRFITEDAYWGKDADPLSLNLYTYCSNNPIMYFDPSGLSGETAAVAASMWWLCAVDSPFLPFGDIAYGLTVAGTAVYEYGPAAYDWSTNVAAPWVRDEALPWIGNAANDVGNWISKAADDSKEAGEKALNWIKEQFGGSGNQDPNKWDKVKEILKAGDQTKDGWTLTEHAAENANLRGFSLSDIDNVIRNYSYKFYSYGEEIYAKKVDNYYQLVIKARTGTNIVITIGGKTHSLKTIADIEKFFKNAGTTITTVPLD